ncbi:TPA: signal recognition particle protein [archaeon]|uniref:Signal recognition particle 54 kDa protein n=1 Tax=Candidatus Naiadarchaeum limnaeum TaxID=2756139 RepID=A0A832XGY3_9ARCH|nr:signal recognition particle protein [Candidatus Naiadarchaeales archaeon SRR2090153.bin1042]HIK00729.1 signal recognition particle protein [Candidatus Naiadarchaeum limnaeum]
MVLDKLGKSLREALRKIARAGYIDSETLDTILKEIQRALLMADVRVDLVFKLTETIKNRASNEKPPSGLSAREHILNIVYGELTKLLGGSEASLKENAKKIMLVGLFGSGKTTTCAKLAKFLQKKGLKVCLIGTDIWRPAAFEQLKQLGAEINVPVFGNPELKDPARILKEALTKTQSFDIVIVDSAGRDALDKDLSKELKAIADLFRPDENLLVLSSDIGQKASDEAHGFNTIVPLNGVILTKMDSSAKGGGALSACAALGIPIKFVGLGEKVDAFETFNGTKFVSKLLGMGDLESLVKKTEEIFAGASKDQMEAVMKGDFNLKDFRAQIDSMRKMGPLKKIFEMLPMGSLGVEIPEEQFNLSEEKVNKFIYVMDSMTPQEMENPDVINASRLQRIAKGSGTAPEEVKALLNHYNMTKKMIKRFGKMGRNKKTMEQLSKRFKGFPGFKGF